jgi:hypothetical protein
MFGQKFFPYSTLQELNLDWILTKVKNILRFVPDDGYVGQILRRTKDGAEWSDEQGGGGAVNSVNGQTGTVVLTASDVGALPDSYTAPVTSVNTKTGAVVLDKTDIGLGNVANVAQYSASNPPPYPVTSVNTKTGAVVLDKTDVGLGNVANVAQYSASNPPPYPVTSVNGQTGDVTVSGGAVDSVNGYTGDVVLTPSDIGLTTVPVTPTLTKTSGNSSVYSVDASVYGKMVTLWIIFNSGNAVNSGQDAFVGTLSGVGLPVRECMGSGYYQGTPLMVNLKTNGTLTVRVTAVTKASGSGLYGVSVNYIAQ